MQGKIFGTHQYINFRKDINTTKIGEKKLNFSLPVTSKKLLPVTEISNLNIVLNFKGITSIT